MLINVARKLQKKSGKNSVENIFKSVPPIYMMLFEPSRTVYLLKNENAETSRVVGKDTYLIYVRTGNASQATAVCRCLLARGNTNTDKQKNNLLYCKV